MKTSKEMQLKIIDKMRENVEMGVGIFEGIQYLDECGNWGEFSGLSVNEFHNYAHRIKPETITINSVEIPKPLSRDDIKYGIIYYYVNNNKSLYEKRYGEFIHAHGIRFVYSTKAEAITASKALFGIES